MNAPTAPSIWQAFAQLVLGVAGRFAMAGLALHGFLAGPGRHSPCARSHESTLPPSLRSGPSQAGPALSDRQLVADWADSVKFRFQACDTAVKPAAITTDQRGSLTCASRLSFSFFFPRRWPAACRIPHRAGWLVLLQAPSSPMPPRVTSLPAPSSVALRALRPAASSLACRPATRATELAAFGRITPASRTIRADRPGGPFVFARF